MFEKIMMIAFAFFGFFLVGQSIQGMIRAEEVSGFLSFMLSVGMLGGFGNTLQLSHIYQKENK